jgi:hypothetical protein
LTIVQLGVSFFPFEVFPPFALPPHSTFQYSRRFGASRTMHVAARRLTSARLLYQASRLSSLMPTQKNMQSQITGKVNFAVQLFRETAELLVF